MPRKAFQILKVERLVPFLATGRKLLLELAEKQTNKQTKKLIRIQQICL